VRVTIQKIAFSSILVFYGFDPSVRAMQDRVQENAAARANPADRPALIQGKTIDAWLAALKDSDPTVRKRAVEVLGERTLDPTLPADQKASLQTEVRSLLFSDKDAAVRQAAAFFADLFKVSGSPEMVDRLLEHRRRAVDPTRRAIRVVDAQGRPIEGALVSTYFQRARAQARYSGPPGRCGALRDSAAQGSSAGRLAQGHARGARQADHHRDASGLPRAR
jgi:HEAT repeats